MWIKDAKYYFGTFLVAVVGCGVAIACLFIWYPIAFKSRCSSIVYQVDDKLPPFFEGVFRRGDFASKGFRIEDPVTMHRGKPLNPEILGNFSRHGPTDILGFRNKQVPNVSDVVVIGDSHTIGFNVEHSRTWSTLLEEKLLRSNVYNMGMGGWGALQYLSVFKKSFAFQPQVIIIGVYSGNDAFDSFSLAYSSEHWKDYRSDSSLSITDLPVVDFPPAKKDWWAYRNGSGFDMVFTPSYRRVANDISIPAVRVGYQIIEKVLSEILSISSAMQVKTFIVVFPTKELVYSRRVLADNKLADDKSRQVRDFKDLIRAEEENVRRIKALVENLAPGHFIDVIGPLQYAAITVSDLYPADRDGHPTVRGHELISDLIYSQISRHVQALDDGVISTDMFGNSSQLFRVQSGICYQLLSTEAVARAVAEQGVAKPIPRRLLQKCKKLLAEKAADLSFESSETLVESPEIVLPE